MATVRIWTPESDNDREAVKCLANKLVKHLQLGNLSIEAFGRSAIPRGKRKEPDTLRKATQNLLRGDAYVIFVIDSDSPMSDHQRRGETNSLINQIEKVVNDSSFTGRVFLAQAVQELEAWLLIDCLGIFCYFASQSPQHRTIDRDSVLKNQAFERLVTRYQKGDTEKIVEAEIGGKGAKEHLQKFSEQILLTINRNMPLKNVDRQQYREAISPKLAEYVAINQQTLGRNNSLSHLGDVLRSIQVKG